MSTLTFAATESPTSSLDQAHAVRSASFLFLAWVVTLVTLTFIIPFEESWTRSTTYDSFFSADHIEPGLAHGTLERQIALGGFGLLGLVAVAWRHGKSLRIGSTLTALCVAYLAWCAISCLWSDSFAMSSRRFVALFCEVAAGLAIAKHTSARQFVGIVLACTLAWLSLGFVAELALGMFRPWQPDYRFAGIFHPNIMGVNCALLTMSAVYLRGGAGTRSRWLIVIAILALVFLILTGSRTALAAMFVSFAVGWFVIRPVSQRLVFAIAAATTATGVALAIGLGTFDGSASWLAMGRADHDFSSLSGRFPLWQDLLNYYVLQRPLAGHGYGAFWTEDHILDVSHSQTWSVTHAHSTYIDFALNVGLVGAFLCVSAMLLTFFSASRLEARRPGAGYGFIAMIMIFGLTGGLLETYIGITWFLSFFGICGVCYLVFCDEQDSQVALPRTTPPRLRSRPVPRRAHAM